VRNFVGRKKRSLFPQFASGLISIPMERQNVSIKMMFRIKITYTFFSDNLAHNVEPSDMITIAN